MEQTRLVRLLAASLSLGLALAAFPVLAGDGSWSVTGSPAGGGVYQVLVNPATPSILYISSGPGVFKSMDSGADWTLVFPTLNAPADLVMDPLNPDILYTSYGGDSAKTLFRSSDGGVTWEERDSGIGTVEEGTSLDWVGQIAPDPLHEGVLYASSGNTGMYKSTDSGKSWNAINTGLSQIIFLDSSIEQVVVDPVDSATVYLVDIVRTYPGSTGDTSVAGLYQSTDGGKHWHATGLMADGIGRFWIDPADHTHLYDCNAGSLSDSIDSGTTWNSAGSCEPGLLSVTDPSDAQHIIARPAGPGLYQSTDGTSYSPITQLSGVYVSSIAFDPQDPLNVYAGSYSWGLFKSTDGGSTWSQSSTGIHNVVVDEMFEGADGITYLASAGSGIYKSPDQGVTWAQVGAASGPTGSLPITGDFVYSMVEDPTANSTLYAGTTGGLFKSIDGGDTWVESDTGMPAPGYTLALAIDPEVSTTLYSATNNLGVGLYKSVDGGASWNPSASGIHFNAIDGGMQAVAVDPHNSNVVYAGAFGTGLFKSTDGGANWQPDNNGMSVSDVWSVAVDPVDSDIVYTCTSAGFFKSTDGGNTWVESDYGLGGYYDMTEIQFDPSDPSILYVTQRYGIGDAFVSPDAGYTWYDMTTLTPLGVESAAKSVRRQSSQKPLARAVAIGAHPRAGSLGSVSITAAAIGPHSSKMLGAGSDGRVYSFDVRNLPKGGHQQSGSGGGTGGGSSGSGGNGGTAGSSGGGGDLSLLMLGLLGFAALRRKI